MIVVSGRLQIRPWTDKDGNKRRTAEIVADNVYFGESKKDRESRCNEVGVENTPYTGEFSNYAPKSNVYPTPYSTPNYGAYPSNYTPHVKPAVTDWDLLDDDDAQLPF
jgi:single-strand DNA-binding protein